MKRDGEIQKGPNRALRTLARPLIVTLVLGTGLFFLRDAQFSFLPLYVLLASSYLTSFLFFLGYRAELSPGSLIALQHLIDILIASAIVHFSGGILSPFSLLYFLVIISASIELHFRGGFFFATLSSIAYSALLYSHYKGIFTWDTFASDFSAQEVFLRGDLHVICFFLVAMMSGSLAKEFKKRGEELEEMRLTTDDILENMGPGVISVDSRGIVMYFNRSASEILNCSVQDIQGRPVEEALPPTIQPLTDLILEGLSEGKFRDRETEDPPSTHTIQSEEIEVEAGGRKKPLGVTTTLLINRKGKQKGFLLLFSDLTDMKETEGRLRQSERMAAIGELAAGIAHEIRNPLASIRGSAEVLQQELQESWESEEAPRGGMEYRYSDETEKLMNLILREADRLNHIVEDFLQFARARPLHLTLTSLSELLNEVLELVKKHPEFSNGVEIRKEITKDRLSIFVDRDQMKQVFLNICLNGIKAMEGRGSLTISTRDDEERVGVVFQDTGIGINPESRNRIFEPFFTTSEKGHGLGLSIAHRIVEGHAGEIQVESEIGKGSLFIVWIPVKAETGN
jgi:two-component system sensor histidine kinase PilS (NtrC family)